MSETGISMFTEGVYLFVFIINGEYTTTTFNPNYQPIEQLHIEITDIQRVNGYI